MTSRSVPDPATAPPAAMAGLAAEAPLPGLPERLMAGVALLNLAVLVTKFGFGPIPPWDGWLDLVIVLLCSIYVGDRVVLVRRARGSWRKLRRRKHELAVLVLFGVAVGFILASERWAEFLLSLLGLSSRWQLGLEAGEFYLLANLLIQLLRYHQRVLVRGIRPEWVLIGSFALLIVMGTLLLLLPRSAALVERPIRPVEALFTATSAVCVTGLVVRDTGSDFSGFGQVIILVLFQTGGLGIMTFVAFLAVTSASPVPLANSLALRRLVRTGSLAELKRHVRVIVGYTLLVEVAGAALLYVWLQPATEPLRAAGWSFFHAVSAFCNAGFALQADSLVSLRHQPGLVLTFMVLIVLGGLGFLVITDLVGLQLTRLPLVRRLPAIRRLNQRMPVYRLPLQTRLSFVVTALLLAIGFGGFWLLEGSNGEAGESFLGRLGVAAFQSVTCRTAGFNTVDIGSLQPATLLLLMALMVVGACPVSTGGGIKTVTFGVLVLSLRALLLGRDRVEIFGRALPQKVIFAALSVTLLYGVAAGGGTFALALLDPDMPLERQSFEVISALSTVGLSTGITAQLGTGSQLVLCLLMFVGRVGPLSLVLAVFRSGSRARYQYPEEELVVG